MGGADRVLRGIVGVTLLALAFALDMASGWRLLAFLLGVASALTALVRYCPVNAAFGVNSAASQGSGTRA